LLNYTTGTPAALTCRNCTAVGTGLRMAEERTDLVCHFWRENVLKLAGLLLDFVFVLDLESLREKAFREAMSPDDVFSALLAGRSEVHDELAMRG